MSLSGSLQVTEVSQLVNWARQGKRTGAIWFERGDQSKKLYFSQGRVVGSASSVPQEWLGHFLIGRGLITEVELSKAMELQEESDMLLGSILVTIGGITEEQLNELLVEHCTEILCDLLTWTDGSFEFREGEIPRGLVPAEIDIAKALLEGVKRLDEWRRIRKAVPATDRVPIALGDLDLPDDDPIARRVLSRVDDDRSVQEICLDAHTTEYATCLVLTEAIEAGRIKLIAPRAPRRPATPFVQAPSPPPADTSEPAEPPAAPAAADPSPPKDPAPQLEERRVSVRDLLRCCSEAATEGDRETARRYLEAARVLAGDDAAELARVDRLESVLPLSLDAGVGADVGEGSSGEPQDADLDPSDDGQERQDADAGDAPASSGSRGFALPAPPPAPAPADPPTRSTAAGPRKPAYRSIPRPPAPARPASKAPYRSIPRPSAPATPGSTATPKTAPAAKPGGAGAAALDRSGVPRMKCSPEELTSLDLTPEEGFLLTRIDGRMTLGELIKISPMPAEQAERAVGRLVASGHVALEPRRS